MEFCSLLLPLRESPYIKLVLKTSADCCNNKAEASAVIASRHLPKQYSALLGHRFPRFQPAVCPYLLLFQEYVLFTPRIMDQPSDLQYDLSRLEPLRLRGYGLRIPQE